MASGLAYLQKLRDLLRGLPFLSSTQIEKMTQMARGHAGGVARGAKLREFDSSLTPIDVRRLSDARLRALHWRLHRDGRVASAAHRYALAEVKRRGLKVACEEEA